MDDIRINMVISADEHPELHALLLAKPPKTRASILRQSAEFGIWVRRQSVGIAPKATAERQDVQNPARLNSTPAVATDIATVQSVAPPGVPARSHREPNTKPSEAAAAGGDAGLVLDTSLLAGVNFGDLD